MEERPVLPASEPTWEPETHLLKERHGIDIGTSFESVARLLGDKIQLSEVADLTFLDAGLDFEGEAFQCQQLRRVRASQTRREGGLLTRLPLSAEQLREQRFQGRAGLLGGGKLFLQTGG